MRRYLALALCVLLTFSLAPMASAQTRHRAPQRGTQPGILPVPPAEENRALPPGLIPYHEIAPALNALAEQSNRLKLEVIGQSAGGRDLYLATVSDPSAFGSSGRYNALRHLMIKDPERAMARAQDFQDFKVPIFVNCSIHGNEWEGVDACMALIERLVTQNDAETRAVLDNAVVYFNVVQNPDGRVLGQRPNANGFDVNRDFITQSQPEAQITARLLEEIKPMVMLDLHGYVNPMLIEPATPPHNPNYEYDLYIKWALDQAEAMEASLLDRYAELEPTFNADIDENLVRGAEIPFRDTEEGWDDWPPIFTPMFAMYHGAFGATLEMPLRQNGSAENLPPEVREARGVLNTEAQIAAVWGALQFAAENRLEMVLDQMEIFRRGFLDEPQVPIGDEYGEEHEFLGEFPEAYVIPAGAGQASELAVKDLVDFMVAQGIDVGRASQAFTAGGTTYPAGSYVVSMAQPYRGLANTILEPGYDISEVVSQMYDISGWSLGELWGATVVRVEDPFAVRTSPVNHEVTLSGRVPAGRAAAYAFELDGQLAIEAANEMLAAGVALQRTADGRVIVPGSAGTALRAFAQRGITFTALSSVPADAEAFAAPRVALAGPNDSQFVLRELGFDYETVSTGTMNAGFQLDDFDVLVVGSSGLRYDNLNDAARAEVTEFLAGGGDFVGIGFAGARFNDEAGIVDVEYDRASGGANGIVNVDTNAASTIVPEDGDDTAFVYGPVWFTDLGAGVTVDQRYSEGDVLLAGHWPGEQQDAAGQALTISAETGEVRSVLFGGEPLFRAHPRKHFGHVANAIYWATAD